jgi:NAD(P)-dependent dehydrogenase (short-subunit alcohol dehydrogenase family)
MAQRVLVTAGASGIGREIARAFRESGTTVFVCDIDAKALDALNQEMPGVATGVCDVSKRQDIERMVVAAVEALGGLDVLVNNAGISGPTAPVEETNPERKTAMSIESIKRFVDPRDIAALAVFLASDAGKSISGQMPPIDNDSQKAS